MPKKLLTILFCCFFAACSDDKKKAEKEIILPVETTYVWQAMLNDSTGRLEFYKVPMENSGAVSFQTMTETINNRYSNIPLQFVRDSQDTVYLSISDARYLTRQMGSAGPVIYISSLVYNFTEFPGIHYVTLQFEPGDHAQPGTFSRASFADQ